MPYFQGIKNVEIEANTYVENLRAIFRFENDEVYMSNMRLVDIGCSKPSGSAAVDYNELNGALSVIQRIALYSDNVLLDSIDKFQLWSAFKSFNTTNDRSLSSKNNLQKSNIGFINVYDQITEEMVLQKPNTSVTQCTDDPSTTGKAYLSLRDVLPFLASSDVVPTSVYKNLRLEVEFNRNINSDATPSNTTNVCKTVRPLLSCEVIIDEDQKENFHREYKGVTFKGYETTSVFAAAAGDAKQSLNFTLNSYNNKNVERVLIVKEAQSGGSSSTEYGQVGSLAMNKESVNMNINGSQLLPQNLELKGEILSRVTDLFGDCDQVALNMDVNKAALVQNAAQNVGFTDYIAMQVNAYVNNNLQLEYSRTGVAGSAQSNEKMNLVIYGEVHKAIIREGDSIRVQYI